ncbi:MAG TPA: hypothetical protein H9728_01335 [Candidatus Borkfalkia excrementavium]|uniref:Uncharacterized protein n=1 Tax=Candidatus Borkfalkia excrementavium TaxID=2838505 RepID=A0A9D1Z7I1_9FIRM|nr:hypothetical protein [Candidatus Borkfalkia excrementavium]
MQNNKFSDKLLWCSLPDGADIVRAFFSENRECRVLVYRRKDGTYSYIDQTLTFDEYEQEYRWRGADNELSFYDSEESVLSDIAVQTKNMFGFVPVMYKFTPHTETHKKTSVLFLVLALVSIAVVICGLLFTFLNLGGILSDDFWVCGSIMEGVGLLLWLSFLKLRSPRHEKPVIPQMPTIPREAIIFLYRRKELPESGRVFFSEDGTRRVTVFLRDDGCYSYTYQKLYIESDEEEVDIFSAYASWNTENQSVSLYDSEGGLLKDISPLLADMHELLPPDADARK